MSRQSILLEALRALCVLALLFLNFAHQPMPAYAVPGDAFSLAQSLDFCGDPTAGDPAAHAPCHACRLGGIADLPPAPDVPLRPCTVTDVAYGALPVLALPATTRGPQSARGPPALV
jgi:hypothetical protein